MAIIAPLMEGLVEKLAIIFGIALMVALAMVLDMRFSASGVNKVQELEEQVANLNKDQEDLRREIYLLEGQRDSLRKNGAAREQAIRNNLGYLHDDEVVVNLGGAVNK